MNRTKAKQLRQRIEDCLTPLGAELDVVLSVNGGTYTSNRVSFKLEFCEVASDGTVCTKEADAFKLYAKLYGLKSEDLHKTFKYLGDTFEITGLKPRASKYPIVAKNVKTGLSYKFSEKSVQIEPEREAINAS